jgi:type IV pilus assembly protein PilA
MTTAAMPFVQLGRPTLSRRAAHADRRLVQQQDRKGTAPGPAHLVIAILGKAKDSSAKSNARNAVTQIESCLVDETAANCLINAEVLAARGAGSMTITSANSYSVTSTSDTNNQFTVAKSGTPPVYSRTCTGTGSTSGGCPTSLSW